MAMATFSCLTRAISTVVAKYSLDMKAEEEMRSVHTAINLGKRVTKTDSATNGEWKAMEKCKAEWAATHGPEYRGVTHDFLVRGETPVTNMGEDYWRSECERDKDYLKLRGERSRRQRLRR